MRINVGVPEAHVSKPVLDAALESVTRLNESLLADHAVPTAKEGIKRGVLWNPEPEGDEHFDHAGLVMRRGWGDCDDLAPWHAASLRATGEDPEAKAVVRRSGPHRWHAIVQRGDGSIDDPSKWAGMGQPHPTRAASLPLMVAPGRDEVSGMYMVKPTIALRPVAERWQARTDLPWHWRDELNQAPRPTDYAMVSLHTDPVSSTALVGALRGACKLGIAGGFAHPAHIARLNALADALDGVSYDEVAACYGDEHAVAAEQFIEGSFFGKVRKLAKKVARAAAPIVSPIVKQAAKLVPGGALAVDVLPIAKRAATAAFKQAVKQGVPAPVAQKMAQQAADQVVTAAQLKNMGVPEEDLSQMLEHLDEFPAVDDSVDLSTLTGEE